MEDLGLRVAYLAPCSWPEVRRGAERFVRELSAGLIADGHHPTLITSHAGAATEADEDGLRVLRSRRPPSRLLDRANVEDYVTHVPASFRRLRRGDYDIANAVHASDAVAAARWSKVTGRPSVFSYMGVPIEKSLRVKRGRMRMTRHAVEHCDATVSLSEAVAQAFRDSLGVETRVIPPPVDTETFSPGGERHQHPTIFCAAAVAAPPKRVHLLVQALPIVRRSHPRARLVLSDPGDAAVRERVAANTEGVEFAVVDDRAALADAYRSAWVTALPSVGEAFGLVLTESLACGTPVVGSDQFGIPEIVDSPAIGRIFDGGAHELAAALLEALDLSGDPATATACRARAEDFSRDRCVAAYERLYAELIEARG